MIVYKTRAEIRHELCISTSTLRRRMEEAGINPPKRRALHPRWQKAIYEAIFWPDGVCKADYDGYDLPGES